MFPRHSCSVCVFTGYRVLIKWQNYSRPSSLLSVSYQGLTLTALNYSLGSVNPFLFPILFCSSVYSHLSDGCESPSHLFCTTGSSRKWRAERTENLAEAIITFIGFFWQVLYTSLSLAFLELPQILYIVCEYYEGCYFHEFFLIPFVV